MMGKTKDRLDHVKLGFLVQTNCEGLKKFKTVKQLLKKFPSAQLFQYVHLDRIDNKYKSLTLKTSKRYDLPIVSQGYFSISVPPKDAIKIIKLFT